jgi:hypothetical protein
MIVTTPIRGVVPNRDPASPTTSILTLAGDVWSKLFGEAATSNAVTATNHATWRQSYLGGKSGATMAFRLVNMSDSKYVILSYCTRGQFEAAIDFTTPEITLAVSLSHVRGIIPPLGVWEDQVDADMYVFAAAGYAASGADSADIIAYQVL